jgi:hypothetical protein
VIGSPPWAAGPESAHGFAIAILMVRNHMVFMISVFPWLIGLIAFHSLIYRMD